MKYNIITIGPMLEAPRNRAYIRQVEAKEIAIRNTRCLIGREWNNGEQLIGGLWTIWDNETGMTVAYSTTRKGVIAMADERLKDHAHDINEYRRKAKSNIERDGHTYPVNE